MKNLSINRFSISFEIDRQSYFFKRIKFYQSYSNLHRPIIIDIAVGGEGRGGEKVHYRTEDEILIGNYFKILWHKRQDHGSQIPIISSYYVLWTNWHKKHQSNLPETKKSNKRVLFSFLWVGILVHTRKFFSRLYSYLAILRARETQ